MNQDKFLSKLNDAQEQSVINFTSEFEIYASCIDISKIIATELNKCRESFLHTPIMRADHALSISIGDWYCVDIMAYEDKDLINPLATHPSDTVFYFLTPATATIFSIENYENRIFSREAKIANKTIKSISPGSTLPISSSTQIASFTSNNPIITIALSNKRLNMYNWDFDMETGSPINHYNNYPVNTMVELITKLLGCYGDKSSIPCISSLLDNDSDTIKWQAAQALLRIDAGVGIDAFRLLSKSSNPHVARASQLTLAQL